MVSIFFKFRAIRNVHEVFSRSLANPSLNSFHFVKFNEIKLNTSTKVNLYDIHCENVLPWQLELRGVSHELGTVPHLPHTHLLA